MFHCGGTCLIQRQGGGRADGALDILRKRRQIRHPPGLKTWFGCHAGITARRIGQRPGRRDMRRNRLQTDLHGKRVEQGGGGLRVDRIGWQARVFKRCGADWLEPVALMMRGMWNRSRQRKMGSQRGAARRMGT